MDAAAEFGRNPVVSTRFSLSMEMSKLTRDGTAEPVSRDQILRHARGQGNIMFPCCSADHEQDWQPYPFDPYCAICDDDTYIPGTYIYTYTVDTKVFSHLSPVLALRISIRMQVQYSHNSSTIFERLNIFTLILRITL